MQLIMQPFLKAACMQQQAGRA